MPMSRHLLLVPLAAMAVGVAACSGGGTTKTATPTSFSIPSTTSTAPVASTCGPAPSGSAGSTKGGDVAPPGDIPDTVKFVSYSSPAGHYSLTFPEGFARSDQGSVVTFTDKLNTIRVDVVAAAAAPTVSSVTQELDAVRAQVRCFESGKVTTVQRKAGTVLLATYRADSAPDPVTGKVIHDDVERYEFWTSGTTAVVTLSSPKGSDNVDPWRKVTDSFTWTA